MKSLQLITISLLCLSACGKEVERVVYAIPDSHSTPAIKSDNDNDNEECDNNARQRQHQQTSASQIRECVRSGVNLSRQ